MRRVVLVLFSALLTSACHVPNRLYNKVPNSIVAVPHDPGHANPDCDPVKNACLAFIEFDDMGEFWDVERKGPPPSPGEPDTRPVEPKQLTEAINLINKAKAKEHPIIIVFVHGWKNNAEDRKDETGNVFGFENVLEFLKTDKQQYPDSPVVGIYIGWRGDLISKYWVVRRQLSLFNREAAAIRIPGASMTQALTRIMLESHRKKPGAEVIMVGHSFGGLVLERALTQAMTDYVLRERTEMPESTIARRNRNADEARIWADLVVFVNSAAAASEAKQMLNLLKGTELDYSSASTQTSRPLLLSISSLGDTATRFGLPIGHGRSYLGRKIAGSWRTYESPDPPQVTAQSSFYLSTTAHMEVLQSHAIVDAKDLAKNPALCGSPFRKPFPITTGQVYQICERPRRWNDTPYWVMQMPATIVPDHSGIFNENFIRLLKQFMPSQEEMRDPALRPGFRTKAVK